MSNDINLPGFEEAPPVPAAALQAGLAFIKESPRASGVIELIARRPGNNLREVISDAHLDTVEGLRGDTWLQRGSARTPDKRANPNAQITVMNARAVALIAGTRERWALAGDQVYTDLDLSVENLPAGSRLRIGEALIEITPDPHLGCAKFKARFGEDALAFVNSPEGRALRLRGANAKIIEGGMIRIGDYARKMP